MNLLLANANTTQAITDLCAASARAAASPGTTIIPATPHFGPAVIATRAENIIAGHALLELLAEHAEKTALHGILLAVSHDTALEAARQLMPCPVLGMTEAACLVALTQGGRFGLITFGHVDVYRELITRHGFAARLSGLLGVDATPQQVIADPAGVAAKVQAGIAALVAEGADSIILGGAAMAGMGASLTAPVPLLDGIACGVRLLEALAGLRLPKPATGSCAAPTGRAATGITPALAALLAGPGK